MASSKEGQGSSRPTSPKDFAVTTPEKSSLGGDGLNQFILPQIIDIQKQLGQLTQAVATLTENSKDHGRKLNRISHVMYTVGVVGTILLAILVFFANKIADAAIALLKAQGH